MGKIVSTALEARLSYAMKHRRSVTIADVAKGSGVDRGALTRLEQGGTERYDGPMMARLCDYYGCDLSDLLKYIPGEDTAGEEDVPEDSQTPVHEEMMALVA